MTCDARHEVAVGIHAVSYFFDVPTINQRVVNEVVVYHLNALSP